MAKGSTVLIMIPDTCTVADTYYPVSKVLVNGIAQGRDRVMSTY